MKRAISLTLLSVFIATTCSRAGKEAGAKKTIEPQQVETAKCAVDGMLMNKADMLAFSYKEKTYYVCGEEEKKMFLKNPDKYLKKTR